ncbi:MAG: SDR family oxidoreductase [Alphaproteobacteria bacterium]|nr:SDR family oxidoreductase [Alphaproteobacteria bacterium]
MTSPFSLTGRRALVTGAGTGIGAAIATALAREGARVAVTDLDGKAAERVAARIGGEAIAFALDVTDAAMTDTVMDAAIAALDGLEIVCANAGVSTMNRMVDLTEKEWDYNMAVNAKGVFLTNRAAVRRFMAAGTKGAIVNTASMAGKMGAPFFAHYVASKFAVVGFTQTVAKEVASHGIRVNAVCPGFVITSMQERELVWEGRLRGMTPEAVRAEMISLTPLGRIESPEDVADVVAFLAGDGARFMTGQSINVTGGIRMD